MRYALQEEQTGAVLLPRLEMARTPWQQFKGLLGRKALASHTGLWLEPCNGVHTWFLRFSLDLLFLDSQGAVLKIVESLPPWRVCGPVRHARVVVEMPAGTLQAHPIHIGQHFRAIETDIKSVE